MAHSQQATPPAAYYFRSLNIRRRNDILHVKKCAIFFLRTGTETGKSPLNCLKIMIGFGDLPPQSCMAICAMLLDLEARGAKLRSCTSLSIQRSSAA